MSGVTRCVWCDGGVMVVVIVDAFKVKRYYREVGRLGNAQRIKTTVYKRQDGGAGDVKLVGAQSPCGSYFACTVPGLPCVELQAPWGTLPGCCGKSSVTFEVGGTAALCHLAISNDVKTVAAWVSEDGDGGGNFVALYDFDGMPLVRIVPAHKPPTRAIFRGRPPIAFTPDDRGLIVWGKRHGPTVFACDTAEPMAWPPIADFMSDTVAFFLPSGGIVSAYADWVQLSESVEFQCKGGLRHVAQSVCKRHYVVTTSDDWAEYVDTRGRLLRRVKLPAHEPGAIWKAVCMADPSATRFVMTGPS